MAVSRNGHVPALHRGHCNNLVKYFFTALEASQGGLLTSKLHMTCWRFLRKTDVALPCYITHTQYFETRQMKNTLSQYLNN